MKRIFAIFNFCIAIFGHQLLRNPKSDFKYGLHVLEKGYIYVDFFVCYLYLILKNVICRRQKCKVHFNKKISIKNIDSRLSKFFYFIQLGQFLSEKTRTFIQKVKTFQVFHRLILGIKRTWLKPTLIGFKKRFSMNDRCLSKYEYDRKSRNE